MRNLAGILLCVILCVSLVASAADKPRVYVTDSKSWEIESGAGGSGGTFGSAGKGGARPQTAEIIKTFGERCPDVIVNNKQERADYVVVLEHEGGKSLLKRDNKVAVFNKGGDSIFSKSTRSLGNSVQEACKAITQDWGQGGSSPAQAAAAPVQPAGNGKHRASAAPEFSGAKVDITSQPAGADIEIDGAFVGNTPSSVHLSPGDHTVAVKKNGYKDWERKIRATGGAVTLAAELQKR